MLSAYLAFLLRLTAAGLVVLGLAGCQTPSSGHAKARGRAEARYLSMRSELFLEKSHGEFDTGNLEEAERTLQQATAVDPSNPSLQLLAGRIALERGQLERSYHLFNRAIQIDPQQHKAHYYQGVVLQRWQQFDAAVVCYQRAYQLKPDNVAYLLAIGEMLVALDRADDALKLLTDKLTYFDTNAGMRLAIAQLHALQGRFEMAAEFFEQASILQPDDSSIQEELALARVAAGQVDEAIRILQQLLTEPDRRGRRDLHRVLANCYLMAGRTNDAKAVYFKLTRRDANDVEAWIKLAETCWVLRDLTGTLRAAGRVVALAPRRYEGYLLAGMVWKKRQSAPRALEMFDRAAAVAPSQTLPLILRGMTLEQNGRRDAAAKAYAKALRRQPDDKRAQRLFENVQAAQEQ